MHVHSDRIKLLARVSRIRGQVQAIDTAIHANEDCNDILQTIAACRGALTSLMMEVLEDHVRYHVLDPARKPTKDQQESTDQLLSVLKSYLR